MKFSEIMWELFYGDNDKWWKKLDDVLLPILIIMSVLVMVFEVTATGDFYDRLEIINWSLTLVFTVEYILRIVANSYTKSIKKYILSFDGIIDALSILPFYTVASIPSIDITILRVLRLLRIVRTFKFLQYSKELKKVQTILSAKKKELFVSIGFMLFMIFLSSIVIFIVEHEAQPEKYSNLFDSLWWAVETLTTVGYGDIGPVTTLGKILTMFIAVFGIGIVAIPTGIISSGFVEYEKDKSDKYVHLQMIADLKERGVLSSEEFEEEKRQILSKNILD